MECDAGHCAKTILTAVGDDLIHGVVCIKYWCIERQHMSTSTTLTQASTAAYYRIPLCSNRALSTSASSRTRRALICQSTIH
eukprot:4460560-Lingulodinium_polyedra.AAC.1